MFKFCIFLLLPCFFLTAQDSNQAEHEQFRLILKQTIEFLEKRNLDAVDQLFTNDFEIIFGNQEVVKDKDGLKKFFDEWVDGPKAPLKSMTYKPKADALSKILAKNVAIASGTCEESYIMKDGNGFEISSRWTAVLVKTDKGWRIQRVHSGINPMENPITKQLEAALVNYAAAAGVLGLIIGMVIVKLLTRKK